MFRIEGFVDDRHVALVLRALSGVTRDLKVLPVAEVRSGKRPEAGGDMLELFAKHLGGYPRGQVVTCNDARSFLKGIGSSPTSHGYLVKRAVEAGLLRKGARGSKGTYLVAKVRR